MTIGQQKPAAPSVSRSILIVAAHPDDEVLGCGGTAAKLAAEGCDVHVLLMADGESSRNRADAPLVDASLLEARRAAADSAGAILGCKSVEMLAFPDNRMDSVDLLDVVQNIESCIQRLRPSTVFTHHAGDVNIDHRVVHDAVIAACRPQPAHSVRELLFFEVPSATEWRPAASRAAFAPDWFVDISATLEIKLAALQAYSAELRPFPHPRSLQGVTGLAQWRGASVGMHAAEAFTLGRKLVV